MYDRTVFVRRSPGLRSRPEPEQGTKPVECQRVQSNAQAHDRKGKDPDSRRMTKINARSLSKHAHLVKEPSASQASQAPATSRTKLNVPRFNPQPNEVPAIRSRHEPSICLGKAHVHEISHMLQSTPPNVSLAQRRGMFVRRIVVDSGPVDTRPNDKAPTNAVTVDKLQPAERGSIGLRSHPEQGEYQRVKSNTQVHDRKGKDRDIRMTKISARSTKHAHLEKEPPASQAAQAQANFAMRILFSILDYLRAMLMMPVWIVLALFSSQPPWRPSTATPRATRMRSANRTTPEGPQLLAFDALCEPWSPS